MIIYELYAILTIVFIWCIFCGINLKKNSPKEVAHKLYIHPLLYSDIEKEYLSIVNSVC